MCFTTASRRPPPKTRSPFSRLLPSKRIKMEQVEAVNAQGPFEATWDSLKVYSVPEWYQDANFGIFIHWGPYCVPAFGNEWYSRKRGQVKKGGKRGTKKQ